MTALADGGVLDAIDITAGTDNTALLIVGAHTSGTNAFVYRYDDDANDAAVEAAELALVATVGGSADIINDLVAGNFAFS